MAYRGTCCVEIPCWARSTKGALDDGNAYGSAMEATAGARLRSPADIVKRGPGRIGQHCGEFSFPGDTRRRGPANVLRHGQ